MNKLAKYTTQIVYRSDQVIGSRSIFLNSVHSTDQRWREDKGLSSHQKALEVLANLPDYTFLDGRPTPLGSQQKKRLIKQREIATKMVTYLDELQYAKDRYARLKSEEQSRREQILDNKLKPKGHLMLKKE